MSALQYRVFLTRVPCYSSARNRGRPLQVPPTLSPADAGGGMGCERITKVVDRAMKKTGFCPGHARRDRPELPRDPEATGDAMPATPRRRPPHAPLRHAFADHRGTSVGPSRSPRRLDWSRAKRSCYSRFYTVTAQVDLFRHLYRTLATSLLTYSVVVLPSAALLSRQPQHP